MFISKYKWKTNFFDKVLSYYLHYHACFVAAGVYISEHVILSDKFLLYL